MVQGFGFGDEGFGCAAIQRRSQCIQTPTPRPETRGVLGGGAVDEAIRAVMQNLRQGCGQILRVRGRGAALGLRHEGAVPTEDGVKPCGGFGTLHACILSLSKDSPVAGTAPRPRPPLRIPQTSGIL